VCPQPAALRPEWGHKQLQVLLSASAPGGRHARRCCGKARLTFVRPRPGSTGECARSPAPRPRRPRRGCTAACAQSGCTAPTSHRRSRPPRCARPRAARTPPRAARPRAGGSPRRPPARGGAPRLIRARRQPRTTCPRWSACNPRSPPWVDSTSFRLCLRLPAFASAFPLGGYLFGPRAS